MYEQHFGFSDLPFSVTPDPRFFYSNSVYREAFATLRYGIEARKGFIVITGEVGTGKTTLLKLFMRNDERKTRTAFIFNPKLGFQELLRAVLSDLEIAQDGTEDRLRLLEKLNDYLIEQINQRQIVALLIDEAQDLSDELLEDLRLLSNLETDHDKLLQIVLVGQPELEEKLEQPGLRQLKQRVALRCRLAPLACDEVRRYIDYRLEAAGYERKKQLFDAEAVERIAFHSKGTPRLINMICDNALLIAYAASADSVSAETIEEVARDLQLTRVVSKPATPPEAETGEGRYDATVENPMPAAALPHNSPAEFPDDFIDAKPPVPKSGVAGVATGMVLGFLVASTIGAVVYSQRAGLPELASRFQEQVDAGWENLKQINLVSRDVKWVSADLARSEAPVTATPDAAKQPSKTATEAAAEDQPAPASPAKIPVPLSKNVQVDSAKAGQTKEPRIVPQLLPLQDGATPFGREKSLDKDPRPVLGNFEVVENSFLRSRPDASAEIIGTLEPGTWVRVESRSGEYFRVRSLHDGSRGYVHREDAFFERIAQRQTRRQGDSETRR